MPLRFLKIFRSNSSAPATDGLAQAEREAILDALHYLTYIDNHLSSAEDRIVQDWSASLDWDKNLSLSSYESRSIGNARRAKESKEYRKEFLDSISHRLASPSSREICYSLLERLAQADGRSPDEIEFIIEFKNQMNKKGA